MSQKATYWLLVICAAAIEMHIPLVTHAITLVLFSTLAVAVIERT